MNDPAESNAKMPMRPSFIRVLAAITYDLLALLAIWFFATLIVVIVHKGQAISPGNVLFSAYLLVCAFAYYGFCWTRGGQTLGMKSWKFKLISSNTASSVNWRAASLRFFSAGLSLAALGLGFLSSLWHPQGRSWHDQLSQTHLVHSAEHD